jgi:carbon-monoxide dehydrogenase large subunit
MGQGIATSLAQLVVDAFGVPIEQVRVVLGDTDRGDGFGSAGSRSLFTGGSAMRSAPSAPSTPRKQLAAQALEAAPEDIRYSRALPGQGHRSGHRPVRAGRAPARRRIYIDHQHRRGPTWPNGCHISEVELDPDTGARRRSSPTSASTTSAAWSTP